MRVLKAIPKKKSGRLLVAVRNSLLKEMNFEAWLSTNYPHLFEEERLFMLRRTIAKLELRIQRAVYKERLREVSKSQLQLH